MNEQPVSDNAWNTSDSNSNIFSIDQFLNQDMINESKLEELSAHKQLEKKSEVTSIYKTVAAPSIQLRELTAIEIKFLLELLDQGRLVSWLIEAMKTIEKIASFFVSKPRCTKNSTLLQ